MSGIERDIPNGLDDLQAGDPVWFVAASGAVERFELLAISSSVDWWRTTEWFVVGTLGQVRDPHCCYTTEAAAHERARQDRQAAIRHATETLRQLEQLDATTAGPVG